MNYLNVRTESGSDIISKTINITIDSIASELGYTSIVVLKGGSFNITSGKTFTIDVPFKCGLFQCFTGTGKAVFDIGSVTTAFPSWWGFSDSASGTTNSNSIQSAITSLPLGANGGVVMLPRGTFGCAPDIISLAHTYGITLSGVSPASSYESLDAGTELVFSAGTIGINVVTGAGLTNATICNLHINGNDLVTTGIKANANICIRDVTVSDCVDYGIYLATAINSAKLQRVNSYMNTAGLGYGLFVQGVNTTIYSVQDSQFRKNNIGIRIEGGTGSTFQNLVVESNNYQGLIIYKNSGFSYLSQLTFNNVWFENNSRLDSTGFSILIDSATRSPSDLPAIGITFNCCQISPSLSTRKYININSARFVRINNTVLRTGDNTDGIVIDPTYGRYVSWDNQANTWNGQSGTITTAYNDEWGPGGGIIRQPYALLGKDGRTANLTASSSETIFTCKTGYVYLVSAIGNASGYWQGTWIVGMGNGSYNIYALHTPRALTLTNSGYNLILTNTHATNAIKLNYSISVLTNPTPIDVW